MEGKRGSECLLKPVSNIDFNPYSDFYHYDTKSNDFGTKFQYRSKND